MIYIQLLESMALITLSAYIYNQSYMFKNFIKNNTSFYDTIGIIIFFSLLSITGTYTGIGVEPFALANTRPIGAIVAGYIGGPLVGLTVGTIAGIHRYFLGGFTALSCAISTIIEGLIGGIAKKYSKDEEFNIKILFISSIIVEILQMVIILIISKPFKSALQLEKIIALPMIIINSLGVCIFISITKNAIEEYKKIGAIQAQKALNIAQQTLKYMKKGFNKNTAKNIANIIYKTSSNNINGVFIGNKSEFLAYCGDKINEPILKNYVKYYYINPDYKTLKFKNDGKNVLFLCTPIFTNKTTFDGVIGLKIKSQKNIDKYFIEFSKELSSLLSTQMELYKLNKIAQEASVAEFKALRAQIHPHFLFNALTTISCFCRTDSNKARELIIDLSNYFRQTLKRDENFVTIKEEIDFTQSYLSIEKARFGNRLKIFIDIPKELLKFKIPAFILQPIVENSIKHGILPKPYGGNIFVKAFYIKDEIKFSIKDTGVGMNKEKYNYVIHNWPGIGLKNINERLKLLYGEQYKIEIKSFLNKGTCVSFLIPIKGVIA